MLKEHCKRIGRVPEEIRLTYSATVSVSENPDEVIRSPYKYFVAGNSKDVIRELKQFCEIGVSHFMVRFTSLEALEHFVSSVVPSFT